jgi:hypothetical protein
MKEEMMKIRKFQMAFSKTIKKNLKVDERSSRKRK